MITRSARKDSRLVTDGAATLRHLKVEAHRANRREARRSCHLVRLGEDENEVTFDSRLVTGWEVA